MHSDFSVTANSHGQVLDGSQLPLPRLWCIGYLHFAQLVQGPALPQQCSAAPRLQLERLSVRLQPSLHPPSY